MTTTNHGSPVPMPDATTPGAGASPSLDVAAAHDALDEVLSAENDAVLAQTVSEVRSRLLALREALPGMAFDAKWRRVWREKAREQSRIMADWEREFHDMRNRLLVAERRASEAEARATRAEGERDALVRALDDALVTSGELGTFTLGDDPKVALHKLMAWSQSVGEHFAGEAITSTERALAEARDDAARWREALANLRKAAVGFREETLWVHDKLRFHASLRVAGEPNKAQCEILADALRKALPALTAATDSAMAALTSAAPTTPTTETRDGQ
jgi:hypothetical protein